MDKFNYLNDTEKSKIVRFCEDKVLVEAVKKVILEPIYNQGTLKAGQAADPTRNGALALAFGRTTSAEELGIDVKAFAMGLAQLEDGFKHLNEVTVSTGTKPKKSSNPGK